jgi:hypothetical protein
LAAAASANCHRQEGENAAMSSKPVKRSELLNCFNHTPFEQQFSSQNEHLYSCGFLNQPNLVNFLKFSEFFF